MGSQTLKTEVRQFALKQFAGEVEKWRKQGKGEPEGIIPRTPFFGNSNVISLYTKNLTAERSRGFGSRKVELNKNSSIS
jgi:hypothetical protein